VIGREYTTIDYVIPQQDAFYQTTRRYKPEDSHLLTHRRAILLSGNIHPILDNVLNTLHVGLCERPVQH
jgi:hypothetical protein